MMEPSEIAAGRAGEAALADEVLVARVRAGEVALYELLVRRYNRAVYRAARALLRDDAEAEDVAQEAWVSAYEKLAQFTGASRFGTWVVAIALNEARSRLRRQAVRAAAVGSLEPGPDAPQDPEREAEMRETAAIVERSVDALPAHHREVFVLRVVEGLPTAEVAAAIGVSEEVVKTRLHRARALLRERLAGTLERSASEAFPFLGARCDRIAALVMARIARGR